MQYCSGITEFRQYVSDYIKSNNCYGRNGYDERAPFIPRVALNEFWSTERIENVLRSPPERIKANSNTIKSRYIVVFSILVFTSQPQHIVAFLQAAIEDTQLPLATTPYVFSETSESRIFDDFHKHQWKFCPLEFDTDYIHNRRRILPYHIVPILDKSRISSYGTEEEEEDVNIYEVTLHPKCFQQTVVVFKVFGGNDPDTERMYENEVDMYSQLVRERAFDHVMRYYGSFETAGLRTIVLEHANGGSLKSYFRNHPPPRSQRSCERFWNSLMGLLRGLENIHDMNEAQEYPKGAWVLRGTHQDIKPQNILVCKNSNEDTYDVTFKFVDMGTGNIRKMKNQGLDRDAMDQAGNGMYSGPEACRDDGEAKGIRGNSDIWSFGGIASEALVWCIWGEQGRADYQTERSKATRLTSLKGGFHEGAFHDGDCLLDVVTERHQRAVAATEESPDWWSRLSDLILRRMLVPEPRERATATELCREWFGPPRLVPHKTEPIQLPTQYRKRSGHTDNSRPTWKAPATDPDIHKGLDRLEIRTEDAEECKEDLQRLPPSSRLTPTILLPQEEDSQSQPSIPGFVQKSSHRRGKSQSRCLHCDHIEHSGLGDEFHSDSDRTSGDILGRKRAVSEGRAKGLAPPTRKVERDNESINSEATFVGEPEIYQPTSGGFIQQSQGFQSEAKTHSDLLIQHRAESTKQPKAAYTVTQHLGRASSKSGVTPVRRPFCQTDQPRYETATIDRVWDECLDRKEEERSPSKLMRTTSTWRLFRSFPQLTVAVNKLRGSSGRDQIFLVDDSISMISHQEAIARACRVLCYILKIGKVDPDFFELHFTSGKDPVISTNSTPLQAAIKGMSFTDKACDMVTGLDQIASNVIDKSKPASIYVLTNGHWNTQEDEKFCFVDYAIGRLVDHIRERKKQRNWVGVQFIRFFQSPPTESDELGRQRLEALDDELKLKINEDIVDTTDYNGDIYKMLLGAVSPVEDQEPSQRH